MLVKKRYYKRECFNKSGYVPDIIKHPPKKINDIPMNVPKSLKRSWEDNLLLCLITIIPINANTSPIAITMISMN